jgi:hypothetical protein
MPLIQPLQGSGFTGPKPLQINSAPYDPKVSPLSGTGEVVANSLKTRAAQQEADRQRLEKGVGAFATQLKENSAQKGMANVFHGRPYAEDNLMAPKGPNPLDGKPANIFFDGKHYYTDPMQVAKMQQQAAQTAHVQAGTTNTQANTEAQRIANERARANPAANPAGGRSFNDVKRGGPNPTSEPPLSPAQANGTSAPTSLQTTAAGASPMQANGSAAPSLLQQAAGSTPYAPTSESADAMPASSPIPDQSPMPTQITPDQVNPPPPAQNVASAPDQSPFGGGPMMAGGGEGFTPAPLFNQNDMGSGWSFQDFGGAFG